jgi:hypothetical protein
LYVSTSLSGSLACALTRILHARPGSGWQRSLSGSLPWTLTAI